MSLSDQPRGLQLTGAAVETLRIHLARQLGDMERLGDLYRDHGLVFTSGVGTLINPTNLRRRSFAPLLQRAGLPQYTSTAHRNPPCPRSAGTLLFGPEDFQELLACSEKLKGAMTGTSDARYVETQSTLLLRR
jgi:hypothetical protein